MTRLGSAFSILFLASATIALSACGKTINVASTSSDKKGNLQSPVSFNRFPDLPFPDKAKIDMGKTIIFGSGEKWFGRLVISIPHDTNKMFDYFKQEMSSFGWQEITSVRGNTSVLTYSRRNRIATIQIQSNTLQGSAISIIVSPQGAATDLPAQNDAPPLIPPPVQRVR